jgi:hypothetical protein
VPRPGLSVDEILGDEVIRAELDRAIAAFVKAIRNEDAHSDRP